jgi:hypothetical protein
LMLENGIGIFTLTLLLTALASKIIQYCW